MKPTACTCMRVTSLRLCVSHMIMCHETHSMHLHASQSALALIHLDRRCTCIQASTCSSSCTCMSSTANSEKHMYKDVCANERGFNTTFSALISHVWSSTGQRESPWHQHPLRVCQCCTVCTSRSHCTHASLRSQHSLRFCCVHI